MREAVRLATKTSARLVFVYVRSPLGPLGDPVFQRHLTEQMAHARPAVERAEANAAGVRCESEILEGDAAETLLDLAGIRSAELIVIGTRASEPSPASSSEACRTRSLPAPTARWWSCRTGD